VALVHVPRSLAALFPGVPRRLEVDAPDLAALIRELDGAYPGMWDRLCEPGPRLRRHINAFVDGQPATLADPLRPDSVVHLIPAVSGGESDGERLHAHEGRPSVRRIPVVAEDRRGLGARVREVLEVALQDQRRAHHLVDAGVRGQRGDVRVEVGLDLDRDVEQHPVACLRVGHQHADLPEMGLLLARRVAEGGAVHVVLALGEDSQAGSVEGLPGLALHALVVGRAGDEDVRDGERGVEREPGRVAAVADLVLPEQPRDVDHHATAVTLAVHVAGTMQHLLKGDEALLDHVVIGLAVAAHGRVERARILVLDRLRTAAGAVRLGGHVTTGGVCARGAGGVLRAQLRRKSAHLSSRVPRLLRAGARRVHVGAPL